MLSAAELKKILANPKTDRAYFLKFRETMLSKFPAMTDAELARRWRELKAHAGICDA